MNSRKNDDTRRCVICSHAEVLRFCMKFINTAKDNENRRWMKSRIAMFENAILKKEFFQ